MVEVLATRGMGWEKVRVHRDMIEFKPQDRSNVMWWPGCVASERNWNPLTDRNALAEVEARLTPERRTAYVRDLLGMNDPNNIDVGKFDLFHLRHAPPDLCTTALCRVLAPELFEGGGK